jgi:DNA polymerase III subunit chi
MTSVEFRTGVPDKLAYTLRWLLVALRQGGRVRVWADAAEVTAISRALWTSNKESFVPHLACAVEQDDATPSTPPVGWVGQTPIVLGPGHWGSMEPQILLNLGQAVQGDWTSYQRIIELVGHDEADKQRGRERWATFKRLGFNPVHRTSDDDA